ncbi:MAG: hypothetical protein MRY64_01640 [Hyphomonadaceae bacterium]|nr:hypothetical protein [Hyphomonadaceae bacterium]
MASRHIAVVLGLLAMFGLVSACAYHSAVPVASPEARLTEAPIPTGRYCSFLEADELDTDCAILEWDDEKHVIGTREGEHEPASEFALAYLRDGLTAAETLSEDGGFPYEIYLFLHADGAVALLPMLDKVNAGVLVEGYPGVDLAWPDDGTYIAAGEGQAVRAFLEACARASLAHLRAEGEELEIAVYAPGESSVPNPAQIKSRERLLALANRLADEAPDLE